MKKVTTAVMLLLMSVLLVSCGTRDMTLEEKVGQMLFVRYPDVGRMEELLSINPGGIIMFGRDFEGLTADEVRSKIRNIRVKIPPVIGVDEEGGTVVRVSSNPNLAPEKYISPQDIYSSGGMTALIRNTAEKSKLLTSLGITMNLAPVADVSQNVNDFIYERSMGADAEETAECIGNIVITMKENGILSCLKHFPGYGSTADTHIDKATDTRSAQSFRDSDFIPFKAGIEAGADSVLVSHQTVPSLDSENPASLSPAIHEILRNELCFDGVIMTDDIAMGAVKGIDNVYVKAVNAGNDFIITTDYMTAYNQILRAVKHGEISEETIDSAVKRILRMKGIESNAEI